MQPIPPTMQPPPHQSHSTYQPEQEQLRLRRRLGDLLRLGAMTPETFQQAILQLWQEVEKRRQSSLQEAEDYHRKYQACLSQAGAFAAQSSILFAVINGFVTLEERRIQETSDRAREAAEKEAAQRALQEAPPHPPPPPAPVAVVAPSPPPPPAQEAAGKFNGKPPGGKRKKR
jgi:hypothetical protein